MDERTKTVTYNWHDNPVLKSVRYDLTSTLNVLAEVSEERGNQERTWGVQNHDPDKWYRILGEEFGEVAHALNEGDLVNYREELIQVAAVAVAMVESIDRGNF